MELNISNHILCVRLHLPVHCAMPMSETPSMKYWFSGSLLYVRPFWTTSLALYAKSNWPSLSHYIDVRLSLPILVYTVYTVRRTLLLYTVQCTVYDDDDDSHVTSPHVFFSGCLPHLHGSTSQVRVRVDPPWLPACLLVTSPWLQLISCWVTWLTRDTYLVCIVMDY